MLVDVVPYVHNDATGAKLRDRALIRRIHPDRATQRPICSSIVTHNYVRVVCFDWIRVQLVVD
jgi:hypothetical protein